MLFLLHIQDLKALLETKVSGQLLMAFYDRTDTLDATLRRDLVSSIVEEFYEKSHCMGMNEFRCMANKIVELFPNESVDVYFVPPNKQLRQKKPTGKLVDRYYNFYRRIAIMVKQQTSDVFNMKD
jgi:hypothetical protein